MSDKANLGPWRFSMEVGQVNVKSWKKERALGQAPAYTPALRHEPERGRGGENDKQSQFGLGFARRAGWRREILNSKLYILEAFSGREMTNKANFRGFWPENEGRSEKQSQFRANGGHGPPYRAPEADRRRWRGAGNDKQSQFWGGGDAPPRHGGRGGECKCNLDKMLDSVLGRLGVSVVNHPPLTGTGARAGGGVSNKANFTMGNVAMSRPLETGFSAGLALTST